MYDDKVREFVLSTGIENIGKRLVNSRDGKVEFEKPEMKLETLLEYGNLLVQEQENVKRVQLADAYLSGAELAGARPSPPCAALLYCNSCWHDTLCRLCANCMLPLAASRCTVLRLDGCGFPTTMLWGVYLYRCESKCLYQSAEHRCLAQVLAAPPCRQACWVKPMMCSARVRPGLAVQLVREETPHMKFCEKKTFAVL